MPGPIVIPNCVEVRLHWLIDQITAYNVLHCQYTLQGPVSPNAPETVFAALTGSAAWTTWNALLYANTHLTAIGIRDLRAPNFPELLSTGGETAGVPGVTALPHQVAMCMTLRTAQAGKQFRGRVYLCGLGGGCADSSGAFILPAANTAGVNMLVQLQSALAAQSMTLAIGQKTLPQRTDKQGNVLPARPANVIPVTQIVALNTRFDTQRRRLQ